MFEIIFFTLIIVVIAASNPLVMLGFVFWMDEQEEKERLEKIKQIRAKERERLKKWREKFKPSKH